ncbi:MAG: hypothetical protein ABIJ18_00295 [archaeon]
MKRVLLFGLFIILLASFVSAGYSTNIAFEGGNSQIVVMDVGDEVRFEMDGDWHSIYVTDISESTGSFKFKVAPFLSNGTNTFPGFCNMDITTRLDLQKDGIYDLYVGLYSFADDGRVMVLFRPIVDDNVITGDVPGVVDDSVEKSNKALYLTLIGVVVVVLVLFLVFRNMGGKEIQEEIPTEEKVDEVDEK